MPKTFSKNLLKWYEQYGRHDLPWQKNQTPYRVWISEIMLQQTQVTTVIPYYARFMARFPDVKTLAAAPEDDVLAHWSGLGYYARARNIHKSAQIVVQNHHGKFPTTVEAMSELPGIGKSTAGAIISFSQQEKAVILDGNVKRVLSRYFAIEKPVNQKDTVDEMWLLADKLTPEKKASEYNQAIMDLGATLCTRSKPRCGDCPVAKNCKAHQLNQPTFYPVKTVKKARPLKKTQMMILHNAKNEIVLMKRESKGIWGGLWSFPECDFESSELIFNGNKLKFIDTLPIITHQFTHFTLTISPARYQLQTKQKLDSQKYVWYKLSTPLPGGVAAPVMKILTMLG